MVNIDYVEGENTFQINNVTLVRNFHSYVSGTKIRVVNAYDTTDELVPYTLFSGISVNGVVYNSVIELAEILSPILFLKQGGSGTATGGVPSLSGNIITRVVVVQMNWTLDSVQQIINFVNNQEFSVSGSQRVLFKAIRIIGDVAASNATESYFWEFKPGKGNYGVNGIPITSGDLEFISFVTNFQNNVIDLGEIGSTPIEISINNNGPYNIILSSLNLFKATRNAVAVNYIYIGNERIIGDTAAQTINDNFIDVNATPVEDPTSGAVKGILNADGSERPKDADGKVTLSDIVDTLTSTLATASLSANQGRILKDYIDAINAILSSDDTTLDELQEVVAYIKANREDLENLSISNIAGLVDALAAKVDDTQVLTNVPANALFTDTLYNDIPIIARVAENEIDVAALEINKQDKLTTDSSLYMDPATQELRANVSSYDQKFTWLTGQSKTRALDFEPTKFLGVLRNGVDTEEYVFTSPTTFEFTGALANADVVKINYEHFIIQP